MTWQEAISKSTNGNAIRIMKSKKDEVKRTILRYKDGSGYCLASKDGKVDFFLSRPAQDFEMDGFTDWEPSENIE